MIVLQTEHFVNRNVTNSFSLGTKSKVINIKDYISKPNDTIASYGILRGVGDILKNSKNYFYLDHGYLRSSSRTFSNGTTNIENLNGYFRIVHNDFIGFEIKKYDSSRLEKLKLEFSPLRTSGEYIILSEPSVSMKNFYKIHNWVDETIKEITKYTDRKIFVHNKYSKIPLDILLDKAWAFVSFQSTAGFKSMIKGVPAHFTHKNLEKINSIANIEKGKITNEIFNSLSYNQWNLEEIKNGEFLPYYNLSTNTN